MSRGLAIVLLDNQYEVLEFHYSRLRLQEAGFKVVAAAPKKGRKDEILLHAESSNIASSFGI
jgi:putative intracellular protease/amidase